MWYKYRRGRRWPTSDYPPALHKACCDPFEYAIRLRTGETWEFEQADPINRDWVRIKFSPYRSKDGVAFRFDRGVDVRVSDIVWVADAPHGS
jgi:hypothetical protein